MTDTPPQSRVSPPHSETEDAVALAPLAARGAIGGALMGLANLVPGISGGTMLLAAGVYPRFVRAVADVTTLRLRRPSVVLLAAVVGAAMIAIVGLAAPLRDLVVERRWMMYSLFIGLTLGGVPLLLRMIRPAVRGDVLLPALAGLGAMIAMALLQPGGSGAAGGPPYWLSFVAGMAGAAAMVLPGVSGGYLLLLLGMYVPILDAIATAKAAAGDRDVSAFLPALHVIIPVGIGVVVGVVGISNLVRVLLQRAERPTVGLLLGLLLGAVVGLWPFQAGIAPVTGDAFRGGTVEVRDGVPYMVETDREVEPKNWPTEFFSPTPMQVAGSAGLVLAGLAASLGVGRLGREKPPKD